MSGPVILAAVLCAASAALLLDVPLAEKRLRFLVLSAVTSPGLSLRGSRLKRLPARLLFVAVAAALVGFLVAGPQGSIVSAVLGVVVVGLLHQIARAASKREQQLSASAVAPYADLLAACLQAGASPADAVAGASTSLGGPLQEPLSRVVVALRAGADPAQAWALAADCPALRPIARAFVRASRSGAPLAATVSMVADEQRRIRRWQAEAAARRAGVLTVAPLVLCFLPAFILVGVVPVIVGMATQVLAGQ